MFVNTVQCRENVSATGNKAFHDELLETKTSSEIYSSTCCERQHFYKSK